MHFGLARALSLAFNLDTCELVMGDALRAALALCAMVAAAACHRGPSHSGTDSAPGAPPEASRTRATLLGGERGLDHVGIAVKELEAATRAYHELLGFSRPVGGRLPNGIQNVNYYFADATYLETLVVWNRSKATWVAEFTDRHCGALFAVISAFSPDSTMEFLSARGIAGLGRAVSGTIQTVGDDAMPEEKWKTFFLPRGLLPGDPIYFISYRRAARDEFLRELDDPGVRRRLHHRNTALGLRAVWVGVPNLGEASQAFASIGFPSGRLFEDPSLGANGQVFGAGEGELWLVAPNRPDGQLAAYLQDRGGPGIVGITLAAGNVAIAARVVEQGTGVPVPTYRGQLGTSIRVAPRFTEGVWLEFAQQF